MKYEVSDKNSNYKNESSPEEKIVQKLIEH